MSVPRSGQRTHVLLVLPWLLLTLFSGAFHNHPLAAEPPRLSRLCSGPRQVVAVVPVTKSGGERECLACTWLLSSCGRAPASPRWIASPSICPVDRTRLPSPYSPSLFTISVRGPPFV
jgi:hypothetical protein